MGVEQIPSPDGRIPAAMYKELRMWLLEHDPDAGRMLEWSNREIGPPDTPEKMAGEIIWIILCAGRSAQAARTIEAKVWGAIHAGRPVVEAFGYRKKAEAIELAWGQRRAWFPVLKEVLGTGDLAQLVSWCRSIPFVGEDTQYQLAKNFGADLCKPDIWLSRLVGIPDRPRLPVRIRFDACMALCRYLSQATGDRIAVVDSLLWLACNKGVLVTDSTAASVSINRGPIGARSIYESAALPVPGSS
ncbi:hypothetical protein BOC44_21610 (plasmid) [Burkholderia pseudomallei]|nr:hypothetical protein BOC44_21610 [Burkholderia pseudomallei]